MNCKSKTIRALGVRYRRLSGREIIEFFTAITFKEKDKNKR